MDEAVGKYIPRIREICPDLDISSIAYNGEGLVNDVLIANDDIVFRFAKDNLGVQVLQGEIQILDLIRPHVPLDIPSPFYVDQDVAAYPMIAGETLSRGILAGLDEQAKQAAADQLADFLRALHAIPVDETVPTSSAPVKYQDWVEIRRKVEDKVYPLLMAHQVEWARNLFDGILGDQSNFDYKPCLVHGDLGPYHILFDRQTSHITGIIDFGVSGVGDPAIDFGNLLQVYGESFVSRFRPQYPASEDLMKRARFYAQAIELQWVLSGITSGETLWFLAHIGGARDIQQ
jgi:aminoglycoside 2''-phosphotransferase